MTDLFKHKFDVYHFLNPALVTVAINVGYIWPQMLSAEKPCVRLDGWWGPHEYALLPQPFDLSSPYMAWIPSLNAYRHPDFARLTGLDPAIVLLDFAAFPLVPTQGHFSPSHTQSSVHPPLFAGLPMKPGTSNTNTHRLNFCSASERMRLLVKMQVDKLSDCASNAIAELTDECIRPPVQALFYLKQAYYWNLLPGTNTECGHYLILAGMKRAAMELHGFILWYQDYKRSINQVRPIVQPYRKWFRSRGALVENEEDYIYLWKRDIPTWMNLSAVQFKPHPSSRAVSLTPIPIQRQPMFPAGYKGGHHTAIIFYPPEAEESYLFELAARGYASRRDEYRFHTDIARVHEKMYTEQQLTAGLYFPLVKGPANHLVQTYQKDYDNVQPFCPVPPLSQWVIGRQQMEWPTTLQFASTSSRPPPIKTAMPPPLLFFRCSRPSRQESYFFVWITMRDRWISRFAAADSSKRQDFFKTHQEWRDILSATLFMKEAKRKGSHFKLEFFWHSLPQFLFDDEQPQNCIPQLTSGVCLYPKCFDDSNPHAFRLKRLICYDVALTHIKHQFEETDDMVIGDLGFNADCQAQRRVARSDLFRSDIRLQKERPLWEHPDLTIKCRWFERFRGFLRDWPPVGLQEHPHLAITFTDIGDTTSFAAAVNELLTVYYSGVLRKLHVIPTLMWTFPGTDGLHQYLSI